jgi:endoglucanase
MKKIIITTAILLSSYCGFSQGFLHQNGQNIVDGDGNSVLLRGLGLGGWMIQEGYMLQTSSFAGAQHEIRQKIEQLIGADNTETFYQTYRDNGITEADIAWLKAQGFNSIRLPMHYNLYTLPIEQEPVSGQNTWLDEGFERTDLLLQWCEQNEMYLILDMHATPGGQGKDANISDYDSTKPSLWESEANRNKLVALWQQLADRYKDSEWIGGYDLINEPNWAFTGTNANGCDENSNAPLRTLLMDITTAIRQVDTNHLIIIEGNCWGNNYNGMFPLWDDNMTLSFHKYWNGNTNGDIQGILNLRTQYNVPLWLGESGENSNVWFRDAIKLVESNNIGWAWWPMKKVESIAGVTAATKPEGYQQLLDYWTNGGTAPTAAYATSVLMQLAENYKFENVTKKTDVIDAMFRQVQTNETIPYENHTLPGKVFATEYDLGTNGFAYYDTDVATYHSGGGTYVNWNQGWAGRNDGVDIQTTNDGINNGFHVSHTALNEWLLYTINTTALKAYDIDIRYSGNGGLLHIEDQDGKISETISLPATGSYTTWGTATLTDVLVKAGTNKIKIYFETGGFNLNYIEFKNESTSAEAVFKVIDAGTNPLGDKIMVTLNKDLVSGIDFNQSALTLKVNNADVVITSISQLNDNTFVIIPSTPVSAGDSVKFSYAGTNLVATDTTVHTAFTDKTVANRVGNIQQISGQIEAESFYAQSGLQLETTTDANGGQNIGYTDAGDYLDYLVNIGQAGNYQIQYRSSGQSQTGGIKLQLINETTQDIQTVSLAPTGGWQTWANTNSQAALPAGRYYLRLLVTAPGFNLNWIKFSFMAPDDDNDGVPNTNDLCPDTPANTVVDFNGCTIFTLPGNNFTVQGTSESCRSSNNGSISITAAESHNYVATITGTSGSQNMSFTTTALFENLSAGNYTVCITLPEAPSYQQCFDLQITEPEDLAVLSRVMAPDYQVELDLYGGETYTIKLNNTEFLTTQSTIILSLNPGENNLEVKADSDCQGIYRERIMLDDNALVYPNPASEVVYFKIPSTQNNVSVEIFTLQGIRAFANEFEPQDDVFSVNTANLAQGVYVLKIVSGGYSFNTKIVKE